MPTLGVNFWAFRSKGPDFSDPSKMLEAINETAKANYLTPEELRSLAAKAYGKEFAKLDQDWVTRPLPLTLGGITTGQTRPEDASASRDAGPKINPNVGNEADKKPQPDQKEPAVKTIELSGGRVFQVMSPEEEAEHLIAVAKQFARKEADSDDRES